MYTVADCFVSGSTTETFGQTINEALASGILASIPRSPGFKDAYAHLIDPEKFMWKPDDQDDMVRTIRRTLNEGKVVDRARLENWDQAAAHLADGILQVSFEITVSTVFFTSSHGYGFLSPHHDCNPVECSCETSWKFVQSFSKRGVGMVPRPPW